MMILLFEDDLVTDLYPVSISRPVFAISCGSLRLIDLVSSFGCPVKWLVRPHLTEIQEADFCHLSLGSGSPKQFVLAINGAVVPSVAVLKRLRELIAARREGAIVTEEGRIAAAVVAGDSPPARAANYAEFLVAMRQRELPRLEGELPLFHFPHDIIRHHLMIVRESLEHRVAQGAYREAGDGLFLADDISLGQHVVTDTRRGPVVIDQGATIGPYTFLRGPVYVGPKSKVIEHSALKDGATLANTTKIGGEIEASIIEAYTNKQHHGFLGHSYLGSWINLGAGTCNSDLKNTYGQVNMDYHGRKVPSGMQFIGAIIGDYAKTAINTGIFTGKTIGACSMVYGFVTTNVPSFVNYARLFGQVTETPVEVMIPTQGRMFARRDVTQRPCDIQLLRDMYELTRHERQIAGEPLSL
ncbi:MAG: glucose-1-phosphate thymidylyltransferase [Pirellulales bacterium]|nr:glucose-1-phosphate thymidylyltransferase [Pirellulales bacterium]